MRYAIISDIHSNFEALTAVISGIRNIRADRILCLGDIVGYNAEPNECVDMVRSEDIRCIMGNHDACACGLEEPDDFNSLAMRALLWTSEQLTGVNKDFLWNLPRELRVRNFFLFHGSIHDTNKYIIYRSDALDCFRLLDGLGGGLRLGFFGHTHVRVALRYHREALSGDLSDQVALETDAEYLLNPGSVGQPRDRDPRASFLVYDDEKQSISFHRVDYDIRSCQDKIIRAGLPPRLAERLSLGE